MRQAHGPVAGMVRHTACGYGHESVATRQDTGPEHGNIQEGGQHPPFFPAAAGTVRRRCCKLGGRAARAQTAHWALVCTKSGLQLSTSNGQGGPVGRLRAGPSQAMSFSTVSTPSWSLGKRHRKHFTAQDQRPKLGWACGSSGKQARCHPGARWHALARADRSYAHWAACNC